MKSAGRSLGERLEHPLSYLADRRGVLAGRAPRIQATDPVLGAGGGNRGPARRGVVGGVGEPVLVLAGDRRMEQHLDRARCGYAEVDLFVFIAYQVRKFL